MHVSQLWPLGHANYWAHVHAKNMHQQETERQTAITKAVAREIVAPVAMGAAAVAVQEMMQEQPTLVVRAAVQSMTAAERRKFIATAASSTNALIATARREAKRLEKSAGKCGCGGHAHDCRCGGRACGCKPFNSGKMFSRRKDGRVVAATCCQNGTCQCVNGVVVR